MSGRCVVGVQRLNYVADDRHQYHHRRLLSSSFVIIFIVIVIVVIILVIIILVSWPLTFLSCLESLIPISLSSSVHVCVCLFSKSYVFSISASALQLTVLLVVFSEPCVGVMSHPETYFLKCTPAMRSVFGWAEPPVCPLSPPRMV